MGHLTLKRLLESEAIKVVKNEIDDD